MLTLYQHVKVDLLSTGMNISERAKKILTKEGKFPLELREFPTTTGIILVLPSGDYVQAKFSGKFYNPKIQLDYADGKYVLSYKEKLINVKTVPMPSYVLKKNSDGFSYSDIVVTFGDRMRISPIRGCSFHCKYCTWSSLGYKRLPLDWLIDAVDVALKDTHIKPKHLLISGGTPLPKDYAYLDEVYKKVTKHLNKKGIPVEVMLVPRPEQNYLEKLKPYGIETVIINLEFWNDHQADKYNKEKANKVTKKTYLDFIEEAVRVFGHGKVRSGLIVGLEPINETLKGVEELSKRGANVELSPFVPTEGTPLCHLRGPSSKELIEVYEKSKEIADKNGVIIGCSCVPCQYNILAFAADATGRNCNRSGTLLL